MDFKFTKIKRCNIVLCSLSCCLEVGMVAANVPSKLCACACAHRSWHKHTKENLERTKENLERTKENLEHTKENLEPTKENLERTKHFPSQNVLHIPRACHY